jgi:hypothetical protein
LVRLVQLVCPEACGRFHWFALTNKTNETNKTNSTNVCTEPWNPEPLNLFKYLSV